MRRPKSRKRTTNRPVTARWVALEAEPAQVQTRARLIVAALLGYPQPPVDPAGAYIPVPGAHFGEGVEPLSYTELPELLSLSPDGVRLPSGDLAPTRPRPEPLRPARRRRSDHRTVGSRKVVGRSDAKSGDGWRSEGLLGSMAHHSSPNRRPGTGGRSPKASPFNERSANDALITRFGVGNYSTHKGLQMRWWEVDPAGDGILMARLSGEDVQEGDTTLSQVTDLEALAHQHSLSPRYVVTTTKNDSKRRYPQRPDLKLIEGWITNGAASWVAVRGTDRISRNNLVRESFYDVLERTGTGLYLCSPVRRKVDWRTDSLLLRVTGAVDSDEAMRIYLRTHRAIIDRYLAQGKGWPGSQPFGFTRNDHKDVVVDPEQWRIVELIHFGLAGYMRNGTKVEARSLREIKQELAAMGVPMSHEHIRRIACNPMYVTGEWSVIFCGVPIACKPVALSEPIPKKVYQQNAQSFALGRLGKANPTGTFILNHIEFVCGKCLDAGHQAETLPGRISCRLRAYRNPNTGRASYVHYPKTDPAHKGSSYPTWLGQVVVSEVIKLATSPELQREWRAAVHPAPVNRDSKHGPAADADALKQQLDSLARAWEATTRQAVEAAKQPGEFTPEDYLKLTRPIEQEIAALQERIALAMAVIEPSEDPLPATTNTDDGLAEALQRLFSEFPADDLDVRAHQAAVLQAMLSRVIVREVITEDGEPAYELTLEGHMVPPDQGTPPSPLDAARPRLWHYADDAEPLVAGATGRAPWTDGKRNVNEGSPYVTFRSPPIPPERLRDSQYLESLLTAPTLGAKAREHAKILAPITQNSSKTREAASPEGRLSTARAKFELNLVPAWRSAAHVWKLNDAGRAERITATAKPR